MDLEEGECKEFDVRPGQYLVDLDNETYSELEDVGPDTFCFPEFIVRRGSERYTTTFGALTNVRKDKTTKVKVSITCETDDLANGDDNSEDEPVE